MSLETNTFVNNLFAQIIVCGDIVLDVENAQHWISGISEVTNAADIVIGHVEVPHSKSDFELKGDVPAPGADPENLKALASAGFDIITLAGNHIYDCGDKGISDTIETLENFGIKHCGAGKDISSARAPVVYEFKGKKIGVLSYNCVGPENAWAGKDKSGCAYLPIITEDDAQVAPTAKLISVPKDANNILENDLNNLATKAELKIVALHKGIVHTPAKLAPYERDIAHIAIDMGADIVISHHAHILRGIEFYKGKPIFHGLGNGCVVTTALGPNQNHPKRLEWVEKRKKIFGFEPDDRYYLAPFHPEAINAFLGQIDWQDDGKIEISIIPVHVEPPGRPVIADEERAFEIMNYVKKITIDAGLPPIFFTKRNNRYILTDAE